MKRWQIILGIALIALGVLSLLEVLFDINFWRFLGPLFLIGLGVLLILRPRIAGENVKVQMPILGDVRKSGTWEVTDHEIWMIAGTNRLDFTDAVFPEGDGRIRIFGFVADVKITLPDDVGLKIESNAFVSEFKGLNSKEERILSPLLYHSTNYSETQKRINLSTLGFVSDIKVKSSLM